MHEWNPFCLINNRGLNAFRSNRKINLFDRCRFRDLTLDEILERDGNWTVHNSRGRFISILRMSGTMPNYVYNVQRDKDGHYLFTVRNTFYLRDRSWPIYARGSALSKIQAINRCDLSLIRQLYRMGFIEKSPKSYIVKTREESEPIKIVDEVIPWIKREVVASIIESPRLQPLKNVKVEKN